jgi:hypothetical protein
MYQNRARWLDVRTGRFASVDPAEGTSIRPITFQPYLYAGVNPVRLVDPSGRMFTVSEALAVTVAVAVLANKGLAHVEAYLSQGSPTVQIGAVNGFHGTVIISGTTTSDGQWSFGPPSLLRASASLMYWSEGMVIEDPREAVLLWTSPDHTLNYVQRVYDRIQMDLLTPPPYDFFIYNCWNWVGDMTERLWGTGRLYAEWAKETGMQI